MLNWIIRFVVIAVGAVVGAVWPPLELSAVIGGIIGAVFAAVLLICLSLLDRGSPGMIFGGIAGFIVGAWLASTVNSLIFNGLSPEQAEAWKAVYFVVVVAFVAMGLVIGIQRGRWLTPENLKSLFSPNEGRRRYKILDTSVIIDGRVADISDTGFLEGTLVVPQFVLKELQQIADSSQSMKRNRGRRGLEILQKIQKQANIHVVISEKDYPDIPEVDLKLIEMARGLGGKIVTNDYNLNKVAQLRGVEVLNINELANALKPVVLPGEVMRVFVLKEGKEANQGIGYLDDGTMVVVDSAKHLIGTTVELVVTTVLQTTAGKMIFGKTEEDGRVSMAVQQQSQELMNNRKGRRF